MNKSDLIAKVAKKGYMTKSVAETAVNLVFQEIENALLKRGGKVGIDGVGVLENVKRPARNGFNPSKNKVVKIKAGRRIQFRPSSILKRKIN